MLSKELVKQFVEMNKNLLKNYYEEKYGMDKKEEPKKISRFDALKEEDEKIISKLKPDKPEETKEEILKIFIKDSMREELRAHSNKIKELNMRTGSMITGYLMALGHEGHNCTFDANFEFLTLIKKEQKNGKRD